MHVLKVNLDGEFLLGAVIRSLDSKNTKRK